MFNPFQVNVPFYTPWKLQKSSDFLTFLGGIEMEHWLQMGKGITWLRWNLYLFSSLVYPQLYLTHYSLVLRIYAPIPENRKSLGFVMLLKEHKFTLSIHYCDVKAFIPCSILKFFCYENFS